MSVHILHISDMHLGPDEARSDDIKDVLPGAERDRFVERLTAYVNALSKAPDYVVLSGDFTIRGHEDGLKGASCWVQDCIERKRFPDARRVLVVPGNHDVTWGVEEALGWHQKRYRAFTEHFGKVFPHSYLAESDPPLNHARPDFDPKAKGLIGGVKVKVVRGQIVISDSHPFLLDLDKDLLFFAFNSTLLCGVYLKPANVEDDLRRLEEGPGLPDNLRAHVTNLRAAYKKSIMVDGGLIGKDQLTYFDGLMRRMRKQLGGRYDRLTKVAVLHHHVGHLFEQQLEVKRFEAVVDAAQLKQRLIEFNFDLVLHGHKHRNHVSVDATVIPISSKHRYEPLCVVSGGTIGGVPAPNDHQTFKLIVLDEDRGPRNSAHILEVPLRDVGDPAAVIRNECRTYQIPFTARAPGLHDLVQLKGIFDQFLLDTYARALAVGKNVSRGSIEIAAADSLVGGPAKVKFSFQADHKGVHHFFEVILTGQKLNFRQLARIYWMLAGARSYAERENRKCKVVVIVGDLEDTYFRDVSETGEVKRSFDEARKWFKPAIDARFLDLKRHAFSKSEIDRLRKEADVSIV